MGKATLVKPDVNFVKQVKELGGNSLNTCYQCATCSVVCKLSLEESPFPRKEMIWAQWGLRDRLLGDPNVWLCYNCNDCSVHCPRGAKPGEVMAAIRNYSFMDYAFPKFMGKALSQAKYLPFLFGVPVILLLLALWARGIPSGPILFREFLPYTYVDAVAVVFVLVVLMAIIAGVKRFWHNLKEGSGTGQVGSTSLFEFTASYAWPVLVRVLRHDKFGDCEANKLRYWAHLSIFYGFASCFVATMIVVFCIWFDVKLPPWPAMSMVKLFGNAGGISILVGCTLVLYNRLTNQGRAGISTYYGSIFTWIIVSIILSGFLTQFARMTEAAFLAYFFYGIHVIVVFFLLAYLPYSKFAHMIYRVVAMVYAEYSQRSGRR